MGDIWYSTISGMFRSNLVSPLMEIDESKDIFLFEEDYYVQFKTFTY